MNWSKATGKIYGKATGGKKSWLLFSVLGSSKDATSQSQRQ